ncbi:hypothetical protein WKY82_08260 [Gordonia malaquae]|uniref:hypothetical protein n=1 Tax=Gordonia malaquae TaxID=410332 RepID=UPI0030C7925F
MNPDVPVPEWASDALRRIWPTLSEEDRRALIEDRESQLLRQAATALRRTESSQDFGARPAGDFGIDGHDGLSWHAERFEEPWNGWAAPVVTRRTLENLVEDLAALGDAPGRIVADGAFTVFGDEADDGDFEIRPGGDGLYHLYELGWCFVEFD